MNAGIVGASPGIIAPPPLFRVEGDSHSVTVDGFNVSGWVTYFQSDPDFGRTFFGDFAVGGSAWENVAARVASGALLFPAFRNQKVAFHYQAGRIDIANGQSAATVYAGVAPIWAAAKADGCVVGTTKQWAWTGITGDQLSALQAFNALIDTDPSLTVIYDGYARFSPGGTPNLTFFQGDGLHLIASGQSQYAVDLKPLWMATGIIK